MHLHFGKFLSLIQLIKVFFIIIIEHEHSPHKLAKHVMVTALFLSVPVKWGVRPTFVFPFIHPPPRFGVPFTAASDTSFGGTLGVGGGVDRG